ncbi:hypothetical protein FHS18_003863 [Paenibacillus phyllosphaerae]|uniref:DUF2269 domain-containing protein n=1 Tax=Paenibacillus phyllosphaerae TaxID=274593 RepID=A0A7W5AZS1_9BACL|nr:hypothetical protein [Paenibacillus phyllosphaerae]MBB3111795.1 hypothetical protein [Paenibacillus phyllosphaerae]
MMMTQGIRKFTLTVHITTSVGWLGAVAVFLALATTGLISENDQLVRSSYIVMDVITKSVILPLSIASLISGVIQSLGTKWGIFRHYWVVVKLILTIIAAIVLILQLEPISYIAAQAYGSPLTSGSFHEVRLSLVVHAVGGIVVLLSIIALSVFKPRGITRYGWRKQLEQERS